WTGIRRRLNSKGETYAAMRPEIPLVTQLQSNRAMEQFQRSLGYPTRCDFFGQIPTQKLRKSAQSHPKFASSNEKEISHGRGPWQGCSGSFVRGPWASSIG